MDERVTNPNVVKQLVDDVAALNSNIALKQNKLKSFDATGTTDSNGNVQLASQNFTPHTSTHWIISMHTGGGLLQLWDGLNNNYYARLLNPFNGSPLDGRNITIHVLYCDK